MMTGDNLLITGPPGIGKSTLVGNICEALADRSLAGFATREIRHNGRRRGFELISMDGQTALLSHVDLPSPFRVGQYGVDVEGFEAFLQSIPFFAPEVDIVVIDEIGKMECFSALFREMTQKVLDADKKVLATVAMRGGGLIADVKARWDVCLKQLTWENRDHLLTDLIGRLI
jgi:nucleoside-triphosphatase